MANEKLFIDYGEIVGSLGSYHRDSLTPDQRVMYDWIMDEIYNAEVVDAVEVKHAWWIELPSMEPDYKCSECGRSYAWWEPSEAHYCPNCGALMDGKDNVPRTDGDGNG
jgi:DNA-directed RNA polymerase subunit RPC12/RpoP